MSLPQATEICTNLDQAVEFAALEGQTAAQAIAAFIQEGNLWSPVAGWSELALAQVLPVMPRQASRLLRTSDDETSAVELERIAAGDPVLAGKLLGAANSALYGSRIPIASLLQAILRLGIPEARRTLLASCLASLYASKPLHDLWEHSQTIAKKARDLAAHAQIDPDTAFTAGLLHDIGRLAFARLPAHLRIVEMNWLAAGFPVVYAESLAYGIDHATLGAECLRAWGLPDNIVEAVEFHHRPECSRSRLSAVVTLADDFSEDLWADMRRTAASLTLGLDPAYETIATGSMCG
jgi:putative nucleotidyltransferase with HDIG domain